MPSNTWEESEADGLFGRYAIITESAPVTLADYDLWKTLKTPLSASKLLDAVANKIDRVLGSEESLTAVRLLSILLADVAPHTVRSEPDLEEALVAFLEDESGSIG